jgi:hypothetical protein
MQGENCIFWLSPSCRWILAWWLSMGTCRYPVPMILVDASKASNAYNPYAVSSVTPQERRFQAWT